jgi:hypothetical protein
LPTIKLLERWVSRWTSIYAREASRNFYEQEGRDEISLSTKLRQVVSAELLPENLDAVEIAHGRFVLRT